MGYSEGGMKESRRVLIYGSRGWTDSNAIRNVILKLTKDDVVIHGGAGGADSIAGRWAQACGIPVEVYPADWRKYGRAAGPIRNQQMIDEGKPTEAYGFRMKGASRGTDDMCRRVQQAGILPHSLYLEAEAWTSDGPSVSRPAPTERRAHGEAGDA